MAEKMSEKETPNYYAIIPANVRYDKDLTANAKLLYGEITALCNEKGYCWASNDYFANLYGVSKASISSWISQLAKSKYITIQMVYKEGSKEILHRYIRLFEYPIQENLNTPIQENLNTPIQENMKDNITVFNNTYNNTYNKETGKPVHPQAVALSSLLFTLHKEQDPKYNVSTTQLANWAADIEKIARLDGRDYDEIERVLRWAKADGFWCPNIMSGKKLREKFPTLYAQMTTKRGSSKPLPVHERTTWLDMED